MFGSTLNIKQLLKKTKTQQHALINYSNYEYFDRVKIMNNHQLILGRRVKVEYALKSISISDTNCLIEQILLALKSNDRDSKE